MTSQRPPPAPPADGFFSRWSRRKEAARQADPETELDTSPAAPSPEQHCLSALAEDTGTLPIDKVDDADRPEPPEQPRPLSLVDVQALSAQSDFVPFMARGVAPDVRNAAMKKLFADPHYNVMDGLDIYIDDYSKSTPLPIEVIKRLASAKFLGLFEEDPPPPAAKDSSIESPGAEPLPIASPDTDTSALPREFVQTEAPDLQLNAQQHEPPRPTEPTDDTAR